MENDRESDARLDLYSELRRWMDSDDAEVIAFSEAEWDGEELHYFD